MAKDVIHISEAEAASDFAALMARVRAGAEIRCKLRPQLVGRSRIRQCVQTDCVEIVRRSTEAAFDDAQKFTCGEIPACGV